MKGFAGVRCFPGTYQVALVPDHENCTVLVNGKQYRGSLLVYQVEQHLNIINEVTVEDYVQSRLATQFERTVTREAMAAVAIVERTEATYAIQKRRNPYWDLTAAEVGYQGYGIIARNPEVSEAVEKNTLHGDDGG